MPGHRIESRFVEAFADVSSGGKQQALLVVGHGREFRLDFILLFRRAAATQDDHMPAVSSQPSLARITFGEIDRWPPHCVASKTSSMNCWLFMWSATSRAQQS